MSNLLLLLNVDFPLLAKAILLGLAYGYFCFGHCLPAIFPYFLSINNLKRSLKIVCFFLSGRLLGYLFFGFLFALLGRSLFSISSFHNLIIPILYIFLSILLFLYAIFLSFPYFSFCQILKKEFTSNFYPFFIGLIMGINICPPFLLSILNVMEIGNILKGILFFFFFFLATSFYFFPLIFFSFLVRHKITKIISQISAVLAALYFLYKGIIGLKIL